MTKVNENTSGCDATVLTERLYVDLHTDAVQRTCLSVLLHTVAAVVELGEGGGELVQVVAECVEQQVVQDLLQDLWEAQDALPQLPLLLVVQDDLRGLCCFPQRCLGDVSQTSDGPTGRAEQNSVQTVRTAKTASIQI